MDDVQALADAVADAARAGRQLQVAGRPAPAASHRATDPVVRSLRRLCWVLDIDRDARSVTVQPGATLGHLARTLTAHGLALADLPSDPSLTVGEVLALGAAGTGVDCGSLANQIVAIDLVDGTGRLRRLSAEDDPLLFRAAQVGLGATGLVTGVTLRYRADYNLAVQLDVDRTETVLDRLAELRRGPGHLELTWLPALDRCLVLRAAPTDEEPTRQGRATLSRRLRRSAPELRAAASLAFAAGGALTRSYRWVDRAHRVLLGEFAGGLDAPRYALPAETTGQVWHTLRAWLAEYGGPAGQPIRFRFGAGDRAYLSPASGRPTVWVEVPSRLVHKPEKPEQPDRAPAPPVRAARELDTLLAALGARPQWGNPAAPAASDLAARYPGWPEWCEARRQLDPHGLFEPAVPI